MSKMTLTPAIEIDLNPRPMFHTEIAGITGSDGTEGSIALLTVPFGAGDDGYPAIMGTRTSSIVVFEHEGRRGQFDLARVFESWVNELGDAEPEEDQPLTQEEDNELIAEQHQQRRDEAKKRWEEAGEPEITEASRKALGL